MMLLLLLVVIAAVAAYLWYRQKQAPPANTPPPSNRFHAVTIKARANACPAARSLVTKKFIAKEAPRLPLENCTVPNCQCSYEHYDDRRAQDRRDAQDKTHYKGNQKRTRKDRRKVRS